MPAKNINIGLYCVKYLSFSQHPTILYIEGRHASFWSGSRSGKITRKFSQNIPNFTLFHTES
jgi:hypothetical protein